MKKNSTELTKVETEATAVKPGHMAQTKDFIKKTGNAVRGAFGKLAVDIKGKAAARSEKKKADGYEKRMEKYNPLFPEVFYSEAFALPNVIKIVDDAERRDIDVCEGAIGWTESVEGVEVLCLYDEFIPECGITFYPIVKCDSIYCVDCFDRKKFLDATNVFSIASQEKLAELEHIAYSLGAKSCSIEIVEAESNKRKTDASVKSKAINGSYEAKSTEGRKQSAKTLSTFVGSDKPKAPTLKWFAHDDGIKRLVEMRCSDENSIQSKRLEIKCSLTTSMSVKTACAIDKILKIPAKLSMEHQAQKEQNSILVYEIDF